MLSIRALRAAQRHFLWLPRRFHAYGIGVPRSGTTSLATMLQAHYRAAHEPQGESVIRALDAAGGDPVADPGFERFLRRRDRTLRLELESSHFTHFFLAALVREFPSTRFVLTMRDCYSWLASWLDYELAHPVRPSWVMRMRTMWFGRTDGHPKEERVLEERGMFTLDGYLSAWARAYGRGLTVVPAERLLLVRTHEIATRAGDIARFLGIPETTLDLRRAHSNRTKRRFHLLRRIDPQYLRMKVEEHCGPLMARYFPGAQPAR